MSKKITATQRLVQLAMTCSEAELNQVLEVIGAIRSSRFVAAVRKPRKTRSDAGHARGGSSDSQTNAS